MRLILPAILCLGLAGALGAQTATIDATDGNSVLGKLPCGARLDALMVSCPFEYLAKPDDKATLRVRLPIGTIRYIYLEDGMPVSTDSTDALQSRLQGETLYIFVGEAERMEVPASLVSGG